MIEVTDEKIKFIRAAYGRSCAVTVSNKTFFWGQGFKNEKITSPKFFFSDPNGIKDLRFGLNHGLYIQNKSRTLFSWGDRSFGQTGNLYEDEITHICD